MKRSIVLLTALAAAHAGQPAPAVAQSGWSDRGPVFESDARREADERAAEREALRAAANQAYPPVEYPKYMEGGEKPDIQPVAPPIVYFDRAEDPGSIIVDTEARKLFFVLPGKKAYEYPISVGREGFTWTGTEKISRIAQWPSWTPPEEMRQRIPGLPVTVSGGMKNPQGARALYLGNTIYRIHGTNNDNTVGRANSSGCFRLRNEHVVHLASIAKVGTKVRVLQAYAGNVSETIPLSSLFDIFGSGAEPSTKPKTKPKKPAQAKKPAATAAASASGAASTGGSSSGDGAARAAAPAAAKQAVAATEPPAAQALSPAEEAKAAAEDARRAAAEATAAAEAARKEAAAGKKAE